MALYIIMVFCISCRQLFCLLYVLNAVVSCFVHLIVSEAAVNSIFPLSLAFILASGIDKSCLCCGSLLSKMCTAMQARALIPAMCALQEAWVWEQLPLFQCIGYTDILKQGQLGYRPMNEHLRYLATG